jgi:hypothetical protein
MEVNTREALDAPNFGLETLNLSDIQIEFLVEFLRALTDPCVTAKLVPRVHQVGGTLMILVLTRIKKGAINAPFNLD